MSNLVIRNLDFITLEFVFLRGPVEDAERVPRGVAGYDNGVMITSLLSNAQ